MKVELISFTPDALTLLLRTKGTRLSHANNPARWADEKRLAHLEYMRDTIQSSWEFVDFVFRIDGVTRAFTHQLVQTRTGSYAQQSMRASDVRFNDVQIPPAVAADGNKMRIWEDVSDAAKTAYAMLIDDGVPVQDARGLLPTAITGDIIAKLNLRTLSDMAKTRLCTRTQGEYQDVFRAMRDAVIAVYPWAANFMEVHCVATGTCAFPRYGKDHCRVYSPLMDNTAVKEEARKVFWAMRQEACPVAVDGVSVS